LSKLYNHFQQLHSAPNADNHCEKQDEIIKEIILSQFAELDQPFSEVSLTVLELDLFPKNAY